MACPPSINKSSILSSSSTPNIASNLPLVCPIISKAVKRIDLSSNTTPKSLTRNSAKRIAFDDLESCEDGSSNDTLSYILAVVKQIAADNVNLRKELTEVKKLLQNFVSSSIVDRPSEQKPTATYASVAKSNNIVVINPSSDLINKEDCRKLIKDKLKPVNYNLSNITNTKKGGVIVQCPSSADLRKLKSDAMANLGNDFVVTAPVGRLPKVRVFGFTDQYNAIDLVKVLKEQNSNIILESSTVSVVYSFNSKSNSRFGAKLEVDAMTFKRMIDAGKVFVGWDSCRVTEDLNIRRCYKCWGFNHVSSKCSVAQQRCPKCNGNHHQKDCQSTSENCAVCCEAVLKYHIKIDTNHTVFFPNCPSYLHRVSLEHRNIDYGK